MHRQDLLPSVSRAARGLALGAAFLGAVLLPLPPALAAPPATRAEADTTDPVRERMREILGGDASRLGSVTLDGVSLRRLYEKRRYEPVWVNSAERSAVLNAALASASEHGLEDSFPPIALVAALRLAAPERELALTQLALGYATALATGRVRPGTIETDWAINPPAFDAVAGLEKAVGAGKLAEWFAVLPPQHPAYKRLQSALYRYRQVAREGGWPKVATGPTLKPGTEDERVAQVRQRLVVTGDLLPDAEHENDKTYDDTLEKAVRRFQARHGIVPDGAVGAGTLTQMNVPVKARLEQMALNLERWRSLPRDFGRNAINVNVPAAAFELVADGQTVMAMKTVVGDRDHPTPVVQTAVQAIVFNPPWRIPGSIYTKEILPKLKKDRQYLVKNEMVFVPEQGLQQLPGPKNPLGQIKFETPNKFDVYLHDTPGKKAFERWARAQSHGCVRLEKARDLAVYFLQMAQWSGDQVDQAVAAGTTQRVELKQRFRVNLLYATAFADPDGVIEFRDDVYGRDKRLKEALSGAPSLPTVQSVSAPKVRVSSLTQ
jgi:murein L,D-transpeptidase YcbB/YkuD